MSEPSPHLRYRELQSYVGWAEADAERVRSIAPLFKPHIDALIDDFYAKIERHPDARQVITGGGEQTNLIRLAVA